MKAPDKSGAFLFSYHADDHVRHPANDSQGDSRGQTEDHAESNAAFQVPFALRLLQQNQDQGIQQPYGRDDQRRSQACQDVSCNVHRSSLALRAVIALKDVFNLLCYAALFFVCVIFYFFV